MISLQRVSKNFGSKKAVDDVSFTVPEGKTVALLGTSGCGKTTTLRMINRLADADSGQIEIDGRNVRELPVEDLRRGIGYVLQHHGLFPHYTIRQNISIVPNLFKWSKEKIASRISELLTQLHLPENILGQYPSSLSGGQQQRVGLARALAADPPILLMDEPFGALDAVTRADITRDFRRLDILKSKTIVLVTHDIQEAFALADHIILMHQGKIEQGGTPAELLFQPANKFVQDFFDKNRLQSELSALRVKDMDDSFSSSNHLQALDSESTLWEVLENNNGKNKSAAEADPIRTDAVTILQALADYKKHIHE